MLLDNPFHLLGAGPEDERETLVLRVDDLTLTVEGAETALAVLTHPRKRLGAEMAWLPGVGPERRRELLRLLESGELPPTGDLSDLPPLAACNFAASLLARHPGLPYRQLYDWGLFFMPWAFEHVRLGPLLEEINSTRAEAGFQAFIDQDAASDELKSLQDRYLSAVCGALAVRSSAECIQLMADMVSRETEDYLPVLNTRLLELYEGEALAFFEEEGAAIESFCRGVEKLADFRRHKPPLTDILTALWRSAANWAYVGRPLFMAALHQGLKQERTEEMASGILNLSADLSNRFHNEKLADYLNNILLALFPHLEISEIARNNKKIFIYELGWSGSWPLEMDLGPELPARKKALAEKGLARLASGRGEIGARLPEIQKRQPKPLSKWPARFRNIVLWIIIINVVRILIRIFE